MAMSNIQIKLVCQVLVFFVLGVFTGCGDAKNVDTPESLSGMSAAITNSLVKHPKQMTKKGTYTDLRFSHDYDGESELSVIEEFNILVDSGYDQGTLQIAFVTKDGLTLAGESEFQFELTGEDIALPVSLVASTTNTHYLRVLASVKQDGFDSVMETWGVAIHVQGDAALESFSQKQSQAVQFDENSEPLRQFKAEEIIY